MIEVKPRSADLNDEIGERIRAICDRKRFRQIARETGCNHETVRRYLTGRSRIPAEFVARLCAGGDISPSWILLGEGPPRLEPDPPPT